ncbi:MAG: ectoine hydrolase DoeA [Rhizobiaceae bacterium]
MTNKTLNFEIAEYVSRLDKTRKAMQAAGIETLIVTDPSNMNWLSGYDGWSSYVPQCVVVALDAPVFWYGRKMDAPGARITSWLADEDILFYPENYVQTPDRHPMDYLVGLLRQRGVSTAALGVEMDNYFYSARQNAILRAAFPGSRFVDATGLVNWQRAVKSAREIEYMRIAGRIVAHAHRHVLDFVRPGVRKNEVAAELFKALTEGVDGHSGDYSAFMPIMPSGADASTPHLTWDDRPMKAGEGTFFEFGGCYRRYHVPVCRTVFLGKPTQAFRDAEKATLEGMAAGLEQVRPGNTCEDIANAYLAVLRKYGIEKTSRTGYAVGVSYPPDWGERTMSIRPGDKSVLKPGMTFHFMTGLWLQDMGFELTETFLVTDAGYEFLADVPRQLFVKE